MGFYLTRRGRLRASAGIGPFRASIGSTGPRAYTTWGLFGSTRRRRSGYTTGDAITGMAGLVLLAVGAVLLAALVLASFCWLCFYVLLLDIAIYAWLGIVAWTLIQSAWRAWQTWRVPTYSGATWRATLRDGIALANQTARRVLAYRLRRLLEEGLPGTGALRLLGREMLRLGAPRESASLRGSPISSATAPASIDRTV